MEPIIQIGWLIASLPHDNHALATLQHHKNAVLTFEMKSEIYGTTILTE
jgi:hypothetical protein